MKKIIIFLNLGMALIGAASIHASLVTALTKVNKSIIKLNQVITQNIKKPTEHAHKEMLQTFEAEVAKVEAIPITKTIDYKRNDAKRLFARTVDLTTLGQYFMTAVTLLMEQLKTGTARENAGYAKWFYMKFFERILELIEAQRTNFNLSELRSIQEAKKLFELIRDQVDGWSVTFEQKDFDDLKKSFLEYIDGILQEVNDALNNLLKVSSTPITPIKPTTPSTGTSAVTWDSVANEIDEAYEAIDKAKGYNEAIGLFEYSVNNWEKKGILKAIGKDIEESMLAQEMVNNKINSLVSQLMEKLSELHDKTGAITYDENKRIQESIGKLIKYNWLVYTEVFQQWFLAQLNKITAAPTKTTSSSSSSSTPTSPTTPIKPAVPSTSTSKGGLTWKAVEAQIEKTKKVFTSASTKADLVAPFLTFVQSWSDAKTVDWASIKSEAQGSWFADDMFLLIMSFIDALEKMKEKISGTEYDHIMKSINFLSSIVNDAIRFPANTFEILLDELKEPSSSTPTSPTTPIKPVAPSTLTSELFKKIDTITEAIKSAWSKSGAILFFNSFVNTLSDDSGFWKKINESSDKKEFDEKVFSLISELSLRLQRKDENFFQKNYNVVYKAIQDLLDKTNQRDSLNEKLKNFWSPLINSITPVDITWVQKKIDDLESSINKAGSLEDVIKLYNTAFLQWSNDGVIEEFGQKIEKDPALKNQVSNKIKKLLGTLVKKLQDLSKASGRKISYDTKQQLTKTRAIFVQNDWLPGDYASVNSFSSELDIATEG